MKGAMCKSRRESHRARRVTAPPPPTKPYHNRWIPKQRFFLTAQRSVTRKRLRLSS